MKRYCFVILCLFLSVSFGRADNDVVTTDRTQLPGTSRKFITKYFGNTEIAHIVIDKNVFRVESYEVFLTNGTDIEFDRSGDWVEIDGNQNEIPAELIPRNISEYVCRNYALHRIASIEKGRYGYQIKLDNGIELIFDRKGYFREIDD